MRGLMLALLLMPTLTLPAWAQVRIRVAADPPLPVPNLMRNAEFEAGDDVAPEGWAYGTCVPDAGRFARLSEGGRSGAYERIEAFNSSTNAYLSQVTQVRPDTLYRAGAWVRLRGGTMVMWLHGYVEGRRFDERAYLHSWGRSPLVPDFVKLEWTDSPPPDQWLWVGREFRTWPGQTTVNMHLGAYFDRSDMDIDGAFLGLARTTLTITVNGGPLKRVRVVNEAGAEVWTSDDIERTQALTQQIADLPTDTRYQVIVTQPDGREVAVWYPEER